MDSNENNTRESELIFIKNGKVFRKNFPYDPSGRLFPEEEKLLMQSFGIPKEEFDKLDMIEKYEALTESGWTIIRNSSEDPYLNKMLIGMPITQADYDVVMKLLSPEGENIKISPDKVFSRNYSEYGRQFESVALRNLDTKELVDIFMRDKLGQTTEYEKEMLTHFRTFDLERILTGADSKYKINNGCGGVIVITPDEFLTKACSGVNGQHGSAVSDILSNKFHNLYRNNENYNFIFGPEIFKSVMIQCSDMDGEGELIVWTPLGMNGFQYQKLLELQDSLEQIEQKTGKEIRVIYSFASKQQDNDERMDSPKVYKEFLLENHDLIVDESRDHTLEKSTMPEYRSISENELCDCLGIEIPKTKDVGKDVKSQLFAKAKKGLSLLSSSVMSLFREKDVEKEI